MDDPSFADQSTIVMDQSQDIASSPAKLDDDEENNRLMQEEERIRHQRETQRIAEEEQLKQKERAILQAKLAEEEQQKREAKKRWEEEQERRAREELAERESREAESKRIAEESARRKLEEQFMEREEEEERRLMQLEDERSKEREDAEAEERAILQYEYALMKKEEEQKRFAILEAKAVAEDEENMKNAALLSFTVVFPPSLGNEVYRYHIPKDTGTVLDLKLAVNLDFGYSFAQQRFFFHNEEAEDDSVIAKLPGWNASSQLLFFPLGEPPVVPERVLRPQIRESVLADMKMLNSVDDEDAAVAQTSNFGFKPPVFVDYVAEQMDIDSRPQDSPLERMDAEKAMHALSEKFMSNVLRVVDGILAGKIEPLMINTAFASTAQKYVAGGIIVRKVSDWEILGENIGEGDAAFKIAGHELRAMSLLRGKINGIVAPLAAIVDVYGLRYLAQAIPNISRDSLCYGSINDAITVVRSDDGDAAAKAIASYLNIRDHIVTEKSSGSLVNLALPVTAELHRSHDRIVINSAGRIFPPEIPSSDGVDALTKVLRPEFIRNYGEGRQLRQGYTCFTSLQPHSCDECGNVISEYEYFSYEKRGYDCCLSCVEEKAPDGLTYPYQKLQRTIVPPHMRVTYWKNESDEVCMSYPVELTPLNPDALLNAAETASTQHLLVACESLRGDVIAEFVKDLDSMECAPSSSEALCAELHARGINMRFLGKLAAAVRYNHTRELMVREMIARTVKVLIRDGLSFLEDYNENDAKAVIVHYLNQIFTPEETDASLTIWKYIEELTFRKFGYVLEDNTRNKVHLLGLFLSIASKLNITMARLRGLNFDIPNCFSLDDMVAIKPAVKYSKFVSLEAADVLRRASDLDGKGKRSRWHLPGGPEREEASELYRECLSIVEYIYGKDDSMTADCYVAAAEQLESRHQEGGRPENSRWNKCAGVPEDSLSTEARELYTKALHIREKSQGQYGQGVAECWVSLARLGKEESVEAVMDMLMKAVDITEARCGFLHPETAQIYISVALCYAEFNRALEGAPWMRKAFVILMTLFGRDSTYTLGCHQLLLTIEISVDSGLADVHLDELINAIQELEFESGSLLAY